MKLWICGSFAWSLIALLMPSANAATPAPSTSERKAILNALRPAIEAQLGPDIEFVVEQLDVAGGWALIRAEPQRKGGRKIEASDYFNDYDRELMDGITVTALLRFEYKRWNLVEKAVGATDAWYCGVRAAHVVTKCD